MRIRKVGSLCWNVSSDVIVNDDTIHTIIKRRNNGESFDSILNDEDMPTSIELGKYLLTCSDEIHHKFYEKHKK